MTTQVECKLIRDGGSYAEVGGIEYHFVPQEDGAHVAVIENEDHADVFLGIREGYRLYRGAAKVEAPAMIFPVGSSNAVWPAEVQGNAEEAPQVIAETEVPAATEVHDERAELAAEYERLTGEKPHAKTGVKKLRELIAAKQTV